MSKNGVVEILHSEDSVQDVSDFLVIGESYWFCDALGEELFWFFE